MLIRPATRRDVFDYVLARSPLGTVVFQRLSALVGYRAWCAVDGEGIVAFGGLYPWPDGTAREAWVRFEPEAASRLLPLICGMRRVLAVELSGAPIVARVRGDNAAGQRLVRVLGFRRQTGELWGLDGEGAEPRRDDRRQA